MIGKPHNRAVRHAATKSTAEVNKVVDKVQVVFSIVSIR